MTGLAAVLEEHDWITPRGYAWPCCVCGVEFPDAAAVTEWLAERLGSEEVREAVADAIGDRACEYGCATFTDQRQADAALTAVVGALAVES